VDSVATLQVTVVSASAAQTATESGLPCVQIKKRASSMLKPLICLLYLIWLGSASCQSRRHPKDRPPTRMVMERSVLSERTMMNDPQSLSSPLAVCIPQRLLSRTDPLTFQVLDDERTNGGLSRHRLMMILHWLLYIHILLYNLLSAFHPVNKAPIPYSLLLH
jgi:hypothetical protein